MRKIMVRRGLFLIVLFLLIQIFCYTYHSQNSGFITARNVSTFYSLLKKNFISKVTHNTKYFNTISTKHSNDSKYNLPLKGNYDCIDGDIHQFKLKNEDNEVHSFKWLCIESRHPNIKFQKVSRRWYWFVGNRKVYSPAKACNIPQKRITLHTNSIEPHMKPYHFHGFLLENISEAASKKFAISNDTAFFLGKTGLPLEIENLFHFIKEFFFPMYHMIKQSNRLHQGRNVVFYPRPMGVCPGKFSRYELDYAKPFYEMLNIADPYTSVFEDTPKPDKVCYKTAVFSKSLHLNHAHEAIEYIKRKFSVTSTECKLGLITFIARKTYRRILNMDDLVNVAKEFNYDVKIAHLHRMTMSEQAQLIHCTDILVGAIGAGLQWAYFMKNHSGVVEIAWPQFDWPFFFSATHRNRKTSTYSNLNGIRPLRFARVQADKCHYNENAANYYHSGIFHVPSNFTKEESFKIFNDTRNYNFNGQILMTAGKLCDVTVRPEDFREALQRLNKCKENI